MMTGNKKTTSSKAQVLAELAVMGAVIFMLLGYLFQQAFIAQQRQATEMYAFRKALQLSNDNEKSVNLRVIRDVVVPSFFSRINRQRINAVSAVDTNHRYVWKGNSEDSAASASFLQIGDAMIINNELFNISPMQIKPRGNSDSIWTASSFSLDEMIEGTSAAQLKKSSTTQYEYVTNIAENGQDRRMSKTLEYQVVNAPLEINYPSAEEIIKESEGDIEAVNVLPADIYLDFKETIKKSISHE